MTADGLTKSERTELTSIIKMRGRLAREGVSLRQAELLADFEAQLAAIYDSNADAWREVTQEADRVVAEADAVVAARCEGLGIRPEFRPSLNLSWYGRGENADQKRRAELRKVAVTRLDAMAKAAKHEISQQETEARTAIAATALTSIDATAWLDRLPTAEALMPALQVAEVEQITGASS